MQITREILNQKFIELFDIDVSALTNKNGVNCKIDGFDENFNIPYRFDHNKLKSFALALDAKIIVKGGPSYCPIFIREDEKRLAALRAKKEKNRAKYEAKHTKEYRVAKLRKKDLKNQAEKAKFEAINAAFAEAYHSIGARCVGENTFAIPCKIIGFGGRGVFVNVKLDATLAIDGKYQGEYLNEMAKLAKSLAGDKMAGNQTILVTGNDFVNPQNLNYEPLH